MVLRLNPVLVYFSCCSDRIPNQSNLRKGGLIGLKVWGYSPSWKGRHVVEPLDTQPPLFGSRVRWPTLFNLLSPLSSIQDLSP